MTFRGDSLIAAALVCGVLGGVVRAQAPAARPPAATTTMPVATTRAVSTVLNVAPADAWAVLGANDLSSLDDDVAKLGRRLGLPVFFNVSGLVQMGLGLMEGVDPAGGMGLIVLDPAKHPTQAGWSVFAKVPAPVVLAVAATDPDVLIQGLNGRRTEQEGVWSVMLRNEPLCAARVNGYVLLHPDAATLQSLVARPDQAGAARSLRAALPAGVADRVASADVFVYVNVKPLMATYMPLIKGLLSAMSAAGASEAQEAAPDTAAAAMAYLDLLEQQLDKILVLADLSPKGLALSGLVLFQPDSLLAKVFADAKPASKPLLAGLPEGRFVLAAGGQQIGQSYARQLVDLFSRPQIDALRGSEDPARAAKADALQQMADAQVELIQLQRNRAIGIYLAPDGQAGVARVVVTGQFDDAAKAWDLIRRWVKAESDAAAAVRPQIREFLERVTYTPEAETVASTKVHILLIDATSLPELLGGDQMAQLLEALGMSDEHLPAFVKTLFGPDGLKVRIAVAGKTIVGTLGGGTEFLGEALRATARNAAPLATQPAIAKATDGLPKDRIGEVYLSVENAVQAAVQAAQAISEAVPTIQPGQTSAPVALAVVPQKSGLSVDLYVPVELAVSIRGMVNQVMMERRMGAPATRRAAEPETAPIPAPEF